LGGGGEVDWCLVRRRVTSCHGPWVYAWVVVCLWCPFLYWGTYPPFLLLNVRHTALRAREKKKDMLGAKMLLFLVIL
jgi:hypothetical protein